MSITETTRPTTSAAASIAASPTGFSGSLNGHRACDGQTPIAVGGTTSPQAIADAAPVLPAPAGSKAGRSQPPLGTHMGCAAADDRPPAQARGSSTSTADAPGPADTSNDFPGDHCASGTQWLGAAGEQAPVPAIWSPTSNGPAPVRDQAPPAANLLTASMEAPLLADPLLTLSADVLSDLEKVRIANENRLRQLTRSAEDSDGETRGFGLDEAHPDVARLAALVGMLAEAEHKATLNLQRVMRKHPLGPWVAAQKGIGEKQGARLLAAIGDPYIRPEITREDGAVEPSRPRLVSELWAYCGYHVVPASQSGCDAQSTFVGGELNGSDPGHGTGEAPARIAGVAPKRQRGQHANWSAAAKMRAFLVAESCIKQSGTPYRAVYDATRAKYADALHAVECIRCGPKGKPAPIGSALSDGHKHARALRAVAKEVLRDLWREARRIHLEASAGDQERTGIHECDVASGSDHPVTQESGDAHHVSGDGGTLPPTRDETEPMSATSAELT